MKTWNLFTTLVLIGGLGTASVFAQRGSGRGAGPGAGHRMYDPQTVETIRGEVVKVENVLAMQGVGSGVHLLVKTNVNSAPISVHLGPAWFLEKQEIQIKPQDQIQVTGSRIELSGKPALIAAEVTKGDEVLKLRDQSGQPTWAAWRQGGIGGAGMGAQGMRQGMMSKEMAERHQQMMEQHQKLMAEMKAMDEQLEHKVTQMNQAKGEAKVDAIADVINQLVKERRTMRQEMTKMHERMMGPARTTEGMGRPGEPSSSQTETGED